MVKPLLFLVLLVVGGFPAAAQEGNDYAARLELAKKMHEIRPAKAQIQETIDQVSANLSPVDRTRFLKMIEDAFDYAALEKISVNAMADLFTVAELQKMVDYYGSPESKGIAEKLPRYQEKLQPEIFRMLNAAMMAERTGAAAPTPQNAAPKPQPRP